MPKIIQIINTRRDALLALDDSGQLFAYCPEIAGLSVDSWQRIPLLPEHMPQAPATPPPSSRNKTRPEFIKSINFYGIKNSGICPCGAAITPWDVETWQQHWERGHMKDYPNVPVPPFKQEIG